MSPLPVRMVLKKEVVLNSVAEFLGCWAVGGKATLSLNTQDGVTTITFSNTLSGHPEDPLHPPPSPQRRRRHRGPARRERDRQRAAQAGAPPASQAAAPAAPSIPEVLRNAEGSSLDTLTIEKREELEEADPSLPGLTEVVSPPASVPEAVSLPPPHLSPATSTSAAPAPSSDGRKVEEWKCIVNCGETFSTRKELSKHLTSCFSDKVTQWAF